jgi:hypothetical protein
MNTGYGRAIRGDGCLPLSRNIPYDGKLDTDGKLCKPTSAGRRRAHLYRGRRKSIRVTLGVPSYTNAKEIGSLNISCIECQLHWAIQLWVACSVSGCGSRVKITLTQLNNAFLMGRFPYSPRDADRESGNPARLFPFLSFFFFFFLFFFGRVALLNSEG